MSSSTKKTRKGKNKNKNKNKSKKTESATVGLQMPVHRIRKYMKDGNYAPRISRTTPGI